MESFDDRKKKKKCCCCSYVVGITIVLVFAVLFVCLGAGSIPFLSDFYKNTVKKVSFFFNSSTFIKINLHLLRRNSPFYGSVFLVVKIFRSEVSKTIVTLEY